MAVCKGQFDRVKNLVNDTRKATLSFEGEVTRLVKHNTKLEGMVDALNESNIAFKVKIGKIHVDNQANLDKIGKPKK